MKNSVTLQSQEHIAIGNDIANFIEGSKDKTYVSKKVLEKPKKKKKENEEDEEDENVEYTYEKIEVKAKYSIPFKLKYALKRNLNVSKDISTTFNELRNEKIEDLKAKLNIDDKKYSSDKEYRKSIDDKLKISVALNLPKDNDLKEILKKEEELEYYTYSISEKDLESLDEESNVLSYIPESLFDVVIKITE